MRQVTWFVAALLLTTSSAIAADPKQDDAAAHKSAAELAREKMEKRRATSKSAARPTPKQAEATSDRIAASRAKSVYLYAVESCTEAPARCDAALRDDAERRFMDACNVCAPADRCEAERDAIKDGSAKRTSNPCGTAK
jgi:hypothetical protein